MVEIRRAINVRFAWTPPETSEYARPIDSIHTQKWPQAPCEAEIAALEQPRHFTRRPVFDFCLTFDLSVLSSWLLDHSRNMSAHMFSQSGNFRVVFFSPRLLRDKSEHLWRLSNCLGVFQRGASGQTGQGSSIAPTLLLQGVLREGARLHGPV